MTLGSKGFSFTTKMGNQTYTRLPDGSTMYTSKLASGDRYVETIPSGKKRPRKSTRRRGRAASSDAEALWLLTLPFKLIYYFFKGMLWIGRKTIAWLKKPGVFEHLIEKREKD